MNEIIHNEEFQKLVRDLAMQIAGLAPHYVDVDRIPEADLEAKKAELLKDESVQKKPENIRGQIVEGQLKKWYSQVCLYDQPFRDEDRSVRDLITERIATIGGPARSTQGSDTLVGSDAAPTDDTAPVPGKGQRKNRERDKVQREIKTMPQQELARLIQTLEEEMHEAAAELKFEYAARLRDEVNELRREMRDAG